MPYAKPAGYKYSALRPAGYRIFNGYIGGSVAYSPRRPTQSSPYSFSSAPANGSKIIVGGVEMTFTWAGAAGPGVIPLVAGGGTAAQAATAAFTAIAAQLGPRGWVATNPTSAVLVLVSPPNNISTPVLSGATNMALGGNAATIFGSILPGRAGRVGATLPG